MKTAWTDILRHLPPDTQVDNIYRFGSRVYGTAHALSDSDFIIVGDFAAPTDLHTNSGDLHLWPRAHFQQLLQDCDIAALECLWLPPNLQLHPTPFAVPLDFTNLRTAISAKASNSWVKAKKKLTTENETYIAQKSLFHSLRILHFGIQIATHGKITDYGAANMYWEQIKTLPLNYDRWKEVFQPLYNQLKSDFKIACPKNGNGVLT